eukprot:TRINITY_DN20346_c0_g1_i1.p1 TRINITY_DN20346_c0_g1~~TRINITY_DN20346_c0_g1_i1.p1  ORF type:complete len:234 (-),score=41.40 TRINITY_DN20346_c0_g1_i1:655-1356(-)
MDAETQPKEKGTGTPETGNGSGAGVGAGPEGGNFECNICLDLAQDPVITLCGHLFCWPCLYRWLQQSANCKECPVCKAGVSEDKVIPLYGRGTGSRDPRTKPVPGPDIPSRPQGQRPEAVRLPNAQYPNGFNFFAGAAGPFVGAQFGNFTLSAGFGLFPSLFGLQYQAMAVGGDGMGLGNNGGPGVGLGGGGMGGVQARGGGQPVPVEVQQQQYLSRLLLLLGTFVIICLVCF